MKKHTIRRMVWKGSLFPELYDSPEMPLCTKMANKKHKSHLILVHHLNEPSLPFIKALSKAYIIEKIIGIPYSNFESVINELKKYHIVVTPEIEDIANEIKTTIKETKNKIIIEEIGGYSTEISSFLDESENVLGVVEDTKHGHWKWEKTKVKRLPILSIACSKIKEFEDEFVAKSIIDGLEHFLFENKMPLIKDQKIMVLGFGNIGKNICKHLYSICKEMFVYDIDTEKTKIAKRSYNFSSDFSKADIIIGITGDSNSSVKTTDIKKLGKRTLLVSGSSKDTEFDIVDFDKNADKIKRMKNMIHYHFKKKTVTVANRGEPINLKYSVIPSKVLDLVYSGLISCIDKIDENRALNGLSEISEDEQNKLIEEYKKIYNVREI